MTLVAQNVSLRLGENLVLEDVSVTLPGGKVSVIIGPNGAGKTSLIRVLAGLAAPHSGAVTLDGASLASLSASERATRLGYLPQNGTPAWNVTARELVGLGRLPHRSRFAAPSPADTAAIEAALHATDTLHLSERTVDAMSGGERARVKFARVLAGAPQWVLADEPLANLDPAHQLDMLSLLRAEAKRGTGVVIVLHDLNQAAQIADQILILSNGRLAACGSPAEVLNAPLLAKVFGIEAEIVTVADGSRIIVPRHRVR